MRKILKAARLKAGMTQREMAARLNVTERYYQKIEAGDNTGRAALWDALEDLFKVPQRELRRNDGAKTAKSTSE